MIETLKFAGIVTLFTCLMLLGFRLLFPPIFALSWWLMVTMPNAVWAWIKKRRSFRRWFPSLFVALAIMCSGMTCNTSQQKASYNTLYSLEKTTVEAYDGYLSAVVQGVASTNEVPRVSRMFNAFQKHMGDSVTLVQGSTNAMPTEALVSESLQLVNTINALTRKK